MTGFKRWLAALLAGILVLSGGAVFSEGTGSTARDTADIQKSLVSRESSEQTLEQHFLQLMELLQREEVQHLLTIEDFSTITTEVVAKVAVWLIENRPVTMKILEALGICAEDRHCVEKIWDSAERIDAAGQAYIQSEDGMKLRDEAKALTEDPDFQETMKEIADILSSEEMGNLVTGFLDSALESGETLLSGAALLAGETLPLDDLLADVVRKNLEDHMSYSGKLLLELTEFLDDTEWAREPLRKLAANEKLRTLLAHLTRLDAGLDRVLEEELSMLAEDQDVKAFLERTVRSFYSAVKTFADRHAAETQTENKTEETPQ